MHSSTANVRNKYRFMKKRVLCQVINIFWITVFIFYQSNSLIFRKDFLKPYIFHLHLFIFVFLTSSPVETGLCLGNINKESVRTISLSID